jgi:hypothetical protein
MAKTFQFRTKYLNDMGVVELGKYIDDSIAIRLTSSFGEPLGVPTVNLQDYGMKPAEGHVFIRDYGQNEGMLVCLVELGIIEKPGRCVPCGYGKAYECKLLLALEDARIL